MKTCCQCSTRATDDESFCQNCGRQLVIPSCPQCGHPSARDHAFCETCGASLGAEPAFNQQGQSTPSNAATITRVATGGPASSSIPQASLALVLSIISAALFVAAIFLLQDLFIAGLSLEQVDNQVSRLLAGGAADFGRLRLVFGLLGGSAVSALIAVVLGARVWRRRMTGKGLALVALLLAAAALGLSILAAGDLAQSLW